MFNRLQPKTERGTFYTPKSAAELSRNYHKLHKKVIGKFSARRKTSGKRKMAGYTMAITKKKVKMSITPLNGFCVSSAYTIPTGPFDPELVNQPLFRKLTSMPISGLLKVGDLLQ